MKTCGFTIIRNAVKYDYPVVEAIRSILPVCDEFLVLVGNSDDTTLDLIKSIGSPKIRIEESVWDDSLKEGGKVLAVETNKAMDLIGDEFDWAFYIQADEVVHEKYHPAILEAMNKWANNKEVEGLLFKYTHFYGTYNYIGDSRRWYRNEIRIVRNDKSIRSYRDAQGFRKNDQKLKVKSIDAYVYHYGYVKNPRTMRSKVLDFHKLWHDEEWIRKNFNMEELFDFSEIDSLGIFKGTHPAVMQERIKNSSWDIKIDINRKRFSAKEKILYSIEKLTGLRLFEYKNYSILK
ncbi:MAG: glycosyltransferase family 2 protein [Bacteroidales bacterium]|nr:glycosyltransferase family 2 protein [Bacteroidales bacterium]